MRLFPSPWVYLVNPAAITLLIVVAIVMCGCEPDRTTEGSARSVVDSMRCVWSRQPRQCFCVADRYNRGYLTWAPPEMCGDAG